MKKLLTLVLLVAFTVTVPLFVTGCPTAPSGRVAEVQTLKAVGQSAEAALTTVAHLYAQGQITSAQARSAMDFYDQKFQPVYHTAVVAVNSNLDLAAPQDLILLSAQLSALVLQFTTQPMPK